MAPEDRGPQVAGVAIGFLTVAWIFVLLRCYVRGVMTKAFGADDWLAVLSLALFSVYCTFVLKGVQYGTGQHLSDLPETNIPIALKWWFCCELAYVSCTAAFKACICIFLSRVCVKKAHLYTIYVVLFTIVLFSICYFFIIAFQCTPVVYFWTQYTGGHGKCISVNVIEVSSYVHSVLSAVVDWTMGILPIFLVRGLKMNGRTKVSVALILALGAVGSTATIVRIPYLHQLSSKDFLYATTDVAIWSTVEPGIGITAAALACLRPLFRTFLSPFGSSSNNNNNNNNSSHDVFPSSSGARGYIRSRRNNEIEDNELGLRDDVGKGNGIITTIKSVNISPYDTGSDENSQGQEGYKTRASFVVKKAMRWDQGGAYLKDDSDEEILPGGTKMESWAGVRKTITTVSSVQEIAPVSMKNGGLERVKDHYSRFK